MPVFSFGENDMYEQHKGPWIQRIQDACHKLFGFVPIIPRGRGLFQYTFGIVPRRRPINTVGKREPEPIHQTTNDVN